MASETASDPGREVGTDYCVTVIYQDAAFLEVLTAVVGEFGGTVEAYRISDMEPDDLRQLPGTVIILNMEAILSRRPALLDALLEDQTDRLLVFNDAEATSRLAGADRARWARHLLAKIDGLDHSLPPLPGERKSPTGRETVETADASPTHSIWVLAASIGGPEAVRAFLSRLDAGAATATRFVLVQHIGAEFMRLMADQLDQAATIGVNMAADGDDFAPGQVLVVPADRTFEVDSEDRVRIRSALPSARYSPCIDQVIEALVERFGSHVNVIVFSGMASDGIAGAQQIKQSGGAVWVQSPETCVVASMVEGALQMGAVDVSADPTELAEQINQRMRALNRS